MHIDSITGFAAAAISRHVV